MGNLYLQAIEQKLKEKDIPILAVADAAALNRHAPVGFRPEDHLANATRMLIFARPLPLDVYDIKNDPKLRAYRTAFFKSYKLMDETATEIADVFKEEGFPSFPIPSYSPLVFNQGEPWGKMSFKHAAELAGLGKIGKNFLFIHPDKKYGNILRFGGILTTLKLPAGVKTTYKKICPPSCTLCVDACPVQALSENSIDKTRCMTTCIKSSFMPPFFIQTYLRRIGSSNKRFSRFLEWFALVFFADYAIKCMACLLACPHFPGKRF
jgi:epoxyqueuosine reductase QueG